MPTEKSSLLQNGPSKAQPRKECNDVFFLLLFLVVAGFTIYLASHDGGDVIAQTNIQEVNFTSSGYKMVIKDCSYVALLACGISLLFILVLLFAAGFLIWFCLLAIFFGNIAAAYFGTKYLYKQNEDCFWWPAVLFGGLALLSAIYICCVKSRIKFASDTLRVSCRAVLRYPMTLLVSFVMLFFQMGWTLAWILALVGMLQKGCADAQLCHSFGYNTLVIIGGLLIFFWGTLITKNVVAVTVAGTIGSWWMQTNPRMVTIRSWFRSVTLSFGSICFGSLVVAILETIYTILDAMVSAAKESDNCFALCILSCVTSMAQFVKSIMETFNKFAYVYVGVYGYSFMTAGRHVSSLFRSRGWTAIVNDSLIDNVLCLGCLMVSAATAGFAVGFIQEHDPAWATIKHSAWLMAGAGCILGYGICNVMMGVISSAVATIFVCWAEDPRSLQVTHPDSFIILHDSWSDTFPDEYNDGHGQSGV